VSSQFVLAGQRKQFGSDSAEGFKYPGAVYRVLARGSHGQEILQDDQDRQRFLEKLGEACAKTGFWIHACVLMGNYYHLLCLMCSLEPKFGS
jgi:REP element-mobilizing transposase RayT